MEYEQKEYEALADFNSDIMQPQPENAIKYLEFKKGERIMSAAKYSNGWIFGCLKESPDSQGVFPSNYVIVIEKEPKDESAKKDESEKKDESAKSEEEEEKEKPVDAEEVKETEPLEIMPPIDENLKRKPGNTWMEFVKDIIDEDSEKPKGLDMNAKRELSENDILNEALIQNNYNSIIGYKKIRITNDPSQALKKRPGFVGNNNNPTPVLNNEFAMIPVKQQDPNSKAIRLLYHYFDYNKWIEEKNAGLHGKKAKPDIKKKKIKKKVLNLKL